MRKKLWKTMTAFLLASALAFGSVGCGAETTEDNATENVENASVDETSEDTAEDASEETSETDSITWEGDGLNEATVVRVAVQPGNAFFEVNETKKVIEEKFAEYGVEVEYSEFTYGPPIIEAMAAGDIDFAITGNFPVFTGVSNGTKVKAVWNSPKSSVGSQALVVKADSDIETVDDLVGKKIGVPVGSAAHLYLSLLLESGGYSFDDIELVNVAAADIGTSLDNDEIDAGVLWESVLSKTISSIGGKGVLYCNGIMPDAGYLDVTEDFAEKNPLYTAVFVSALEELADYVVENPDETIALLAEQTGDPEEAWQSVKTYVKNSEFTEEDYVLADETKQFLEDNDLLQDDFDARGILTNTYWAKAKELSGE
jgi:ABC-type nitrate/sulfonate/bicarbonate transport system substrate-binding protein